MFDWIRVAMFSSAEVDASAFDRSATSTTYIKMITSRGVSGIDAPFVLKKMKSMACATGQM